MKERFFKNFLRGRLSLLLIFCLGFTLLAACGKEEEGESYQIYYLNMDQTCITPASVKLDTQGLEAKEIAELLLGQMMEEPDDAKLRRVLPETIAYNRVTISGYTMIVDMPAAFYEVSVTEDVLIRAAIVKTLTQIPNIVYISFTVDGEAMVGRDGKLLSKMGAEDFVENPEDAIHNVQETTITLYFADETGSYLKKMRRTISYSSNTSMERLDEAADQRDHPG